MHAFIRFCAGIILCLLTVQAFAQTGAAREEQVTFRNGDVTLAGMLALPKGPGPYPAVALLSGDGQQDRDWTFGKLKMGKQISDRLVARGVAVLRIDDRGAGGSGGGSETRATFRDRCGDARAALRLLKSRPEIGKAGLCGHSGGAIIAGMTAAQDTSDVDFIVIISGPFITGEEVLLDQARTMPGIYRAPSTQSDSEATREGQRIIRLAAAAIRTGAGLDSVRAAWDRILFKQLGAMPKERMAEYLKEFGSEEKLRAQVVRDRMEEYESPSGKDFLVHDPAEDMRKVACPLLVFFGDKDEHVRIAQHRPLLMHALAEGKCPDVAVRIVPEANHAYTSGELYEKGELLPGFVEGMAEWIQERTRN
ncbi:MAG: alpha/beta hydrolase family protein [Candidatus Latescibacterota bacterium]